MNGYEKSNVKKQSRFESREYRKKNKSEKLKAIQLRAFLK